jgi:hypothetical protein
MISGFSRAVQSLREKDAQHAARLAASVVASHDAMFGSSSSSSSGLLATHVIGMTVLSEVAKLRDVLHTLLASRNESMLSPKRDSIFSLDGRAQMVIPRADDTLLGLMGDLSASLFAAEKWALAVDVASRYVWRCPRCNAASSADATLCALARQSITLCAISNLLTNNNCSFALARQSITLCARAGR